MEHNSKTARNLQLPLRCKVLVRANLNLSQHAAFALTQLARAHSPFCSSPEGLYDGMWSLNALSYGCPCSGFPTGAVRVSFGYMSSFEDADAVIRVLCDFFVIAETDAARQMPSVPNDGAASSVAGVATSNGEPSLQGGGGSRAPCGCLLPPGAATARASSNASAESADGAQHQHSANGAPTRSRGASATSTPQQQGSDANSCIEKESTPWDRTFAVVSSPEEPGTPTREEGGSGGFGRVSAMQTVLEALGTEPAAAHGAGRNSNETGAACHGALTSDGLRVQGLCLYPIKSCAAQVPHRAPCAPSCHHKVSE